MNASGLVGRERQLASLEGFLDEATTRGAALLLAGEPGVGKTALLDAAASLATSRGARVVRGSGVDFESGIGFAGLHQLVVPLSAALDRLPGSQRRALEVAVGLGAGRAPTQIAIMNAALSLFEEAAADQPLLLVMDDLHVVDEASRAALGFVARRAAGRRIGVLAARRAEATEPSGMPELEVAPLADEESLRLLTRQFAHLPRRVLLEVAREGNGNPLALLEFAGSTDVTAPRPDAGAARDVRLLFGARVDRLPDATRDLLLLAALDGSGDLGVLERAAAPDAGLGDLEPAERDRLVMVASDGRRVQFRHPLVRSAVVEGSTGEQRRSAHRRLADALLGQPERRGDHLASATTAPDEEVAAVVEKAASSSLRRGDVAGAIARLRSAAALSPDPEARSRRLSRAAYVAAWIAGRLETAQEIMHDVSDQVARGSATRSLPAATASAFLALVADGDADTAHTLLTRALEPVPAADVSEPDHVAALLTLTLTSQYSGRPEHWQPLMERLAPLTSTSPSCSVSLARIHHAPAAVPAETLRLLDEEISRLKDEAAADVVVRVSLAASYVDRLPGCREALIRVVDDGRAGGGVGVSLPALLFLAFDDLFSARWQAASEAAADVIARCEQTGYRLFGQVGHYIAAMAAAHRGDLDVTRIHCEEIWAWSTPRGLRRMEHGAHLALARGCLGAGDAETAYRHLSAITEPGVLPPFNPEALRSAGDLVEAAVRTGRLAQARSHAAALRESGAAAISPRLALMTALATAMTAGPQEAAERFEAALGLPGLEPHGFERGRAELAYGEWLRRAGRARDARARLAAAHACFDRLGAAAWAARAAAELRAAGVTRPARGRDGLTLTPQELEVARLAASGLSNPQIAARLALSPRTVSTHLYRAFPKLGVTSRAKLRDALAAADVRHRPAPDVSRLTEAAQPHRRPG